MADEASNADTPATENTADTPAPAATETATENAANAAETAADTATSDTPESDAPANEPVSVVLEGAALIDTLDKDGLELYARTEFNRELDKRKRIDTLRAEVKALLDGSTQKREAAEAKEAAKVEARASSTPVKARHKTLKNPATGEYWEFEWNPLYAGNADLEPIYAE